MWYDKVILELQEKKTYGRKELFVTLQADNPELSHNSFKWVLPDIKTRQMLTKIGYDSYTRCKDERNLSYQYHYSEIADEVREKISTRFPAIDFSIFEAFMLNEFYRISEAPQNRENPHDITLEK